METLPIGQARVVRKGKDITIISYGASLRPCIEAAEILAEDDSIEVELIDLLTIAPLDRQTIVESVRKTGRAIVVHEGPRTCGLAAEVVASINEEVLLYLEAPVKRVTGYDVPMPYFNKEMAYLPDADKVVFAARDTMEF
jgi:pyruvate dehydrogenase E1 component beta subunit